jgi:hypothetical protein
MPTNSQLPKYDYNKSWIPAIQQRVAVARKLFDATTECAAVKRSIQSRDVDMQSKKNDPDESSQSSKAMAGKVEALRNKMRILLALPLPGSAVAAGQSPIEKMDKDVSKPEKDSSLTAVVVDAKTGVGSDKSIGTADATVAKRSTTTNTVASCTDDAKTMREKMSLLGMLSDASQQKGGQLHVLAEAGRSLAATRWMDGTSGTYERTC